MHDTFPDIKFFEPNEKFLNYFRNENRIVYDIGAGVGHVSKILYDIGINVIALDINHRDNEQYQILHLDATRFNFLTNSVVMLCRPCHGYFTHNAIVNAIVCGVQTIIYVGLERNVELDLCLGYHKYFSLVETNVGNDNENIWVWNIFKSEI